MRLSTIALLLLLCSPLTQAYANYSDPTETFTLSQTALIFSADDTQKSLTVTVTDDILYRYGYLSLDGEKWEPFIFPGTHTGNWITGGQASTTLMVPQGASTDNYVIIYSCSNSGSTWDCHGGKWQIVQFNTSIQDQEELVIAINAGGDAYIAVDGTAYIADSYGTSSNDCKDSYDWPSIAGTQDDELYRSDRCGWDAQNAGDVHYAIPIQSGTYAITLQFAEIWFGTSRTTLNGPRVFDIRVENNLAVNDLNIAAAAGGSLQAYDTTIEATVTDGTLNIDLLGVTAGAKLSALRVYRTGESGPTEPTCDDGLMNGKETGIDCGGSDCDPCGQVPTTGVFVSPMGSDSNAGTATAPFKTLERARTALRSGSEDTVWLRGGTYELRSSFVLDSRDDGTSWKAYPGEQPIISGALQLSPASFAALTSTDANWARFDSAVRSSLRVIDLSSMISDADDLQADRVNGIRYPQLFVGFEEMTVAQWPNKQGALEQSMGQVLISTVYDTHSFTANTGNFDWQRPSDGWIIAHDCEWWTYQARITTTSYSYIAIDRNTIAEGECNEPRTQKPFYVYGILEELDAPGEWIFDPVTKHLYIYPPSTLSGQSIYLSLFTDASLVHLDEAEDVTFQGVTFLGSRTKLVDLDGGEGNTFDACRFFGGYTILPISGFDHIIRDSEIAYGELGLPIKGTYENRVQLNPQNILITNNNIHHILEKVSTFDTTTVGVTFSHNEVHDTNGLGLRLGGNNHLIEYNEMWHIAKDTGDFGPIYVGFDYLSRGSIIRYNYIHDIDSQMHVQLNAIYFDSAGSGQTVYGNIIENVPDGAALMLSGGHYNNITNNIFVNTNEAAAVLDTCRGIYKEDNWLHKGIMIMLSFYPYNSEPWLSAYPEFTTKISEPSCKFNSWSDLYLCDNPFNSWEWTSNNLDSLAGVQWRRNILWNNNYGVHSHDYAYGYNAIPLMNVELNLEDVSVAIDRDTRTITFGNQAAVNAIGFKTIPFDEIGIQD